MSEFLKRANEAPLTVELLAGAMEAIADMPDEDRRDMTARLLCIIRFLDEAGVGDDRANLGLAINFRLHALAQLTAAGGLRGFRRAGAEQGMDWLHEDVIRATVEVPLREVGGDAAFEAQEFHDRLLAIATTAGRA
jgi:hypothetical protein